MRKITTIPVINLSHYPQIGEDIAGYGAIQRLYDTGTHTNHVFVSIDCKTILVHYLSTSGPIPAKPSYSKYTYYAKIHEIPRTGCHYEFYGYSPFWNIMTTEPEIMKSGDLLIVAEIWKNFYYAETEKSAYFFIVETHN